MMQSERGKLLECGSLAPAFEVVARSNRHRGRKPLKSGGQTAALQANQAIAQAAIGEASRRRKVRVTTMVKPVNLHEKLKTND